MKLFDEKCFPKFIKFFAIKSSESKADNSLGFQLENSESVCALRNSDRTPLPDSRLRKANESQRLLKESERKLDI